MLSRSFKLGDVNNLKILSTFVIIGWLVSGFCFLDIVLFLTFYLNCFVLFSKFNP